MQFLLERVNKASRFYTFAILPELLGKCYSRSHIPYPKIRSSESETHKVCTCDRTIESQLITCSDKSCVVKQYHISCLGLDNVPKRKWFCPYCRRKKSRTKQSKK